MPSAAPPSGGVSSSGLVRIISPEANERLRQQQMAHSNAPQLMPELVSYARGRWESAKRSKVSIETEMIESARMRKGEYSPEKLAQIRAAGGSEAYLGMTETKCRTAKAWIEDVMIHPGQLPYGMRPSVSPELSPVERIRLQEQVREAAINQAVIAEQQTGQPVDLNALRGVIEEALVIAEARLSDSEMAQAKAAAEKMQRVISDKLDAGGFQIALRDFIDDIVTYHCAILKGPVGRFVTQLSWKKDGKGNYLPDRAGKLRLETRRVNPLNIYPSADSTGPNDGDLIERTRYTRRELEQMKGVPGYRKEAIDAVLYEHRSGGLREWLWTDGEVDRIRNISQLSSYDTTKIDGLECYLSVPGSLLVDWNIPGVEDLTKEYEIVGILIGRHLVYVTLNPHPLNHRPYSVASMMTNPDGFWGRGIPQSIKHDADAGNMLYRSVINNAAMSASPLIQEMVDRLAPGEVPGQVYPGKVYLTTDDMAGSNQAPIQFFSVPLTANALIGVLTYVAQLADEHSGVPAYAHGSESVGGAGDTASGLSMLMNAAARGIKNVVRNIDEAIQDYVHRMYVHEMLHNPDQTIKGDLEVKVFGSSELLIKEQLLIRRKEILAQTNNPTDIQITGLEGRANLLKSVLKAADIPVEEVIMGGITAPIVDPKNNQSRQVPAQPGQQTQPGQQSPPPAAPPAPMSQATDASGRPAGGTDTSLFHAGGGQ
jgi:hypothetical protein